MKKTRINIGHEARMMNWLEHEYINKQLELEEENILLLENTDTDFEPFIIDNIKTIYSEMYILSLRIQMLENGEKYV